MDTSQEIQDRLLTAIFKKFPFLDLTRIEIYQEAAAEVRKITDEQLRPISGPEGIKALDAWLFFHDPDYIPVSWVVETDGKTTLPLSFVRRIREANPSGLFTSGSELWDCVPEVGIQEKYRLNPFIKAVAHHGSANDRDLVRHFLEDTKESFPDVYLRVMSKLVESAEKEANRF